MNFIRTFFDSASDEELMSLSGGQFLLLRSTESPKSWREYIFNEAMISVKRSGEFDYLLCVERQDVDSDEMSDVDPDDVAQDEMSLLSATSKKDDSWAFNVEDDLKLVMRWDSDTHVAFVWNNTRGDDGDQFEYIASDSLSLEETEKFYRLIKHCTYEAKYRKPSDQATDEELQEILKGDEINNCSGRSGHIAGSDVLVEVPTEDGLNLTMKRSQVVPLTEEALNGLQDSGLNFALSYKATLDNGGPDDELEDYKIFGDDDYDDDDIDVEDKEVSKKYADEEDDEDDETLFVDAYDHVVA